jgi:hypothetical protein
MCYGLFIATGSFFLGQQQVFPAFLRCSIFLTLAALLPLPLLIYWFLRVRFSKAYKNQLSATRYRSPLENVINRRKEYFPPDDRHSFP